MTELDFEMLEFHDAHVESITTSASTAVIELTSLYVCRREGDASHGVWLHRGRLVAKNVDRICLTSPAGLGEEGDCVYSAQFISHGEAVEAMMLVRGVADCACTLRWAISGTAFQFHAESVQLEIEPEGKRLGTWDPATQRMRP